MPARVGLLLPLLLAGLLLGVAGCERTPAPEPTATAPAQAPAVQAPAPATATDPVLLLLGDSLTAAYGLEPEQGYGALLQERIHAAGLGWRVVNAGVSGDTSAGGLARLDWLLRQRVDVMLVALGANDGLRGQDPRATRDNLARIIERAQERDIQVVLAGMRMPANYGLDYTRRFGAVFPELAGRFDVPLVPFLLEGVALVPDLNQADGIHPNAAGARIVADTVWQVLRPVLERRASRY